MYTTWVVRYRSLKNNNTLVWQFTKHDEHMVALVKVLDWYIVTLVILCNPFCLVSAYHQHIISIIIFAFLSSQTTLFFSFLALSTFLFLSHNFHCYSPPDCMKRKMNRESPTFPVASLAACWVVFGFLLRITIFKLKFGSHFTGLPTVLFHCNCVPGFVLWPPTFHSHLS